MSNNSLNKHLQGLYKFAEYLRQSGRVEIPNLNIRWKEGDAQDIEYLTPEEIKELFTVAAQPLEEGKNTRSYPGFFEAAAHRDVAMLTVFYSCGLRRAEAASLDVEDLNHDRRILHVRKGKNYKERFVPLSKISLKNLEYYQYDWRPILIKNQNESALFISQRGRRMNAQSMAHRLKLLQQRSNHVTLQEKNVRPHVLRHSIATHLLDNGMSLENISRFLGHSSLESTQVYTHLSAEGNRRHDLIEQEQPYSNIPKYEIHQPHEDEL